MTPCAGERPNTHTAPFPTAPTPTSNASSGKRQLSFGILLGVSPFSHRNVDSRASPVRRCSESCDRIRLKILPTARQAAALAPSGLRDRPVSTGSLIEIKDSHPSLPAKHVVSKPRAPLPTAIPIDAPRLNSMRGLIIRAMLSRRSPSDDSSALTSKYGYNRASNLTESSARVLPSSDVAPFQSTGIPTFSSSIVLRNKSDSKPALTYEASTPALS